MSTRSKSVKVMVGSGDVASMPNDARAAAAGQTDGGIALASVDLVKSGQVRVGCSGWQYRHWRENFYTGLPLKRWFAHYASIFDTVEVNNSFYRLPEASTFARWADQAPAGFLFAVKASRFLTHMKKLKDPEDPVMRFFERARELKHHLGPVLYQ